MAGPSNYAATAYLNWLLRTGAMPTTTDRYVALYNGDPEGAGAELANPGYGRVKIDGTAKWVAPGTSGTTQKQTKNSVIIRWDYVTTSGTATYTHVAIFDAPTGGNMLHSVARAGSVTANQPLEIQIGGATFDISGT